MSAKSTYLEQARIEELAGRLIASGYTVRLEQEPFDLVAERGDDKLAFEVKAKGMSTAEARQMADQLSALRDEAKAAGYKFRLVIAPPLHRTWVVIPELEQRLEAALQDGTWDDVLSLGSRSLIDDIQHVEVDALDLSQTPYQLKASGTVGVIMANDSEDEDQGRYWSFPFEVEAELDDDFDVQRVISFILDKSAYFGFVDAGL